MHNTTRVCTILQDNRLGLLIFSPWNVHNVTFNFFLLFSLRIGRKCYVGLSLIHGHTHALSEKWYPFLIKVPLTVTLIVHLLCSAGRNNGFGGRDERDGGPGRDRGRDGPSEADEVESWGRAAPR